MSERDVLTLIPFIDAGYAWNRSNDVEPNLISSVGVGMNFSPTDQINASVFYGYRLKQFDHEGHDLQDMGIHFDVTVLAF